MSGMHPTSRRTRVSFRSEPPLRPTAPNCGPVYRRRRSTQTPLYPLVQHHLVTFLTKAAEADPMGGGVPSWVERDFRDHASRGAPCVAAFSLTDSHEHGVPVVAKTFWWRSPAEVGEHVRRVMPAGWSRPPPISSIMSCRRFRCGNECSPFRSASILVRFEPDSKGVASNETRGAQRYLFLSLSRAGVQALKWRPSGRALRGHSTLHTYVRDGIIRMWCRAPRLESIGPLSDMASGHRLVFDTVPQ